MRLVLPCLALFLLPPCLSAASPAEDAWRKGQEALEADRAQEAIGHLCLCVGGLKGLTQFQVGLVRCRPEFLNVGQNRDRKRTRRGPRSQPPAAHDVADSAGVGSGRGVALGP